LRTGTAPQQAAAGGAVAFVVLLGLHYLSW
jgi:hypothetical protein